MANCYLPIAPLNLSEIPMSFNAILGHFRHEEVLVLSSSAARYQTVKIRR
jgi:hypothetical protein